METLLDQWRESISTAPGLPEVRGAFITSDARLRKAGRRNVWFEFKEVGPAL
jgi:hypothetical protein